MSNQPERAFFARGNLSIVELLQRGTAFRYQKVEIVLLQSATAFHY